MSKPNSIIEVTGPDVEAAVAAGLAQLNLRRDAVVVDVIDQGSRGILGIGARPARVRIVVKETEDESRDVDEPTARVMVEPAAQALPEEAPGDLGPEVLEMDDDDLAAEEPGATIDAAQAEEDARVGADTLRELLEKMQIRARVEARRADPMPGDNAAPWVLEIRGRDLGVLIGRRGETLASLQYVARLIASRDLQHRVNFIVDVEGYKSRRAAQLSKLAVRMAEQAVRQGRTVPLEPMPPYERRIIHMALRDNPHVRTESVGEGSRRKVTIIPVKSNPTD